MAGENGSHGRKPGTVRAAAALLRGNHEFAGLWWGSALSTWGDQLAAVALAVTVYARTQSAAWAALVYATQFFGPMVAAPLISGLADRYPRRALMLVCAGVQAVVVAVAACPVPLVITVLGLVVSQFAGVPFLAAQNATLRSSLLADRAGPPLAGSEEHARYSLGKALYAGVLDVGQLVGLAVAGSVVTVLGVHVALAADAVTFAVVVAVTWQTVRSRRAARLGRMGSPRRLEVLRFLARNPSVRAALGLRLLVAWAVVPEGVAVPLAQQLHAPGSVGLLLMIEPAGVIVGWWLLRRFVPDIAGEERLVGLLAVGTIAPEVLLLLGPHWVVVVVPLVVAALCGCYHYVAGPFIDARVSNEIQGAFSGMARAVFRAASGAGVALAGVLAQGIGSASMAIGIAGISGVAVAIPVSLSWRRFYGHSATPGSRPSSESSPTGVPSQRQDS